jgi:hypothetical protein
MPERLTAEREAQIRAAIEEFEFGVLSQNAIVDLLAELDLLRAALRKAITALEVVNTRDCWANTLAALRAALPVASGAASG